jgi:alkylhydroperoxidase/carboxymuconolactone decarboxylase family protein YurZ
MGQGAFMALHSVRDDQSRELTVELIGQEVMQLMAGAPEGNGLDRPTARLVELAVRSCATTLDLPGTRVHLRLALDAGVTGEQVQEMLVLISGLGIHGLIATSGIVADELRQRGEPAVVGGLDAQRSERWEQVLNGDGREARISAIAPDFWPNLVRLSPEQTVQAVMDYRAAPWSGTALSTLQREYIGIAVDTMPSHRFLPTLRMHVQRARELGAGQAAVRQVLDIAAAAPEHRGVW